MDYLYTKELCCVIGILRHFDFFVCSFAALFLLRYNTGPTHDVYEPNNIYLTTEVSELMTKASGISWELASIYIQFRLKTEANATSCKALGVDDS